jgi:hypothetical protein
MRRRKYLVGALVAAVAVSAAGTALAVQTQTATVSIKPKLVPKKKRRNVSLRVVTQTGDTAAEDQVPSPAIRALVNFDNEFVIRPSASPDTCTSGELAGLETAPARAQCPNAIVGAGIAKVRIGGLVPMVEDGATFIAEVTAFNGPPDAGRPTIILYNYVPALNYGQPLVGIIKRSTAGRDYGVALDVDIPLLPLGASLTLFDVNVGSPATVDDGNPATSNARPGRVGYVKAKCGDRNRRINLKARFYFDNGTSLPGANSKICRR